MTYEVKKVQEDPDVWYALIPDGEESITFHIALALAEAMGDDEVNIPPIEKYVPADALDGMWSDCDDFSITFGYEDYDVTVNNAGRVKVAENGAAEI